MRMRNRNKLIPWAGPLFSGREKEYLMNALESTWISGGKYIDKFEKCFTRYNRAKYGITVSNGTTALQLALLALDIQAGDEVIVPGYTFVAPVNMVIASGAKPVYADIDPETWCIDPESVKKSITKRTKAIIPVHIYGNVCDMTQLEHIAARYGLYIIEDTAEASFSKYKGKYAGTFGTIGCYSFQATKTITMGEGGFVITRDKKLYKKMRIIKSHGMRDDKRYWHDMIGYNFRLTNIQAAVGCAQLENIKKIIAMRKRMHGLYYKELKAEPGITMQRFRPEVDPVVWAVSVRLSPGYFKESRDGLVKKMFESGIEVRPGFYPFNVLPLYHGPELKISLDIGLNVISLPSYPSISPDLVKYVCDTLKKMRKI